MQPQTDTARGDPIGNFDQLVINIDSHVINLDHPLVLVTAVKLYLGPDTDKTSSETMKKRRQRLKKKLLHYYGEKKFVLQIHADISDVIINASRLLDQFTRKDDCDQIIITVAKYIRGDIENYCNNLHPLNWPPTI